MGFTEAGRGFSVSGGQEDDFHPYKKCGQIEHGRRPTPTVGALFRKSVYLGLELFSQPFILKPPSQSQVGWRILWVSFSVFFENLTGSHGESLHAVLAAELHPFDTCQCHRSSLRIVRYGSYG